MFEDLLGDPRFKAKKGKQTLKDLTFASRVKSEDPVTLAIEQWVSGEVEREVER